MKASFYTELPDNAVKCSLCPHNCIIKPGHIGICRVRSNKSGELVTENYGKLSAIHTDPVEKKPLYHFYPGSKILSVGSVGCNMQCNFCQNCEISQTGVSEFGNLYDYSPDKLLDEAFKITDSIGIAYTYNEPTVFYEFMLESACISHQAGLKNVMVTNGFIEENPLHELLPFVDAFNVDLKAFSNEFYKKYTHSQVAPVLNALKIICKENRHLEITFLIIPGLNDDAKLFREMISWIVNELGDSTILHLSKYFPRYKSTEPPTSTETLKEFYEIGRESIHYVYVGNVNGPEDWQNTFCKNCHSMVIERTGYFTSAKGIDRNGNCKNCGTSVAVM